MCQPPLPIYLAVTPPTELRPPSTVKMSACDFVASCSSTELHSIAAPEIISSPSLPDMNDSSLHEVVGMILASRCSSFSRASRKRFSQGQKFRSPVSLALMVLKAQFLALERRVYVLEVENGSLKLANGALQSRIASSSRDLSRLGADYNAMLCDRKKLTLVVEQDQQKIRALTSDIDNAQQFIMAMVDIKLHENFLQVAANETMANGEDAEQSLAKAIAQEADRDGSLWSRILSSVVNVQSANSYSAAVDLALQAQDLSLDSGSIARASEIGPTTNVFPPPELDSVYQVTLGDRWSPYHPSSAHDGRNHSASPSETRTRPPTPFSVSRMSSRSPTHSLSPTSNATSKPTKISGLGIRGIFPPTQFTTQAIKTSRPRPYLTPKIEDAKLKPTRKGTASKKKIQLSETQKQSHTKNSDKRKGIIITDDAAATSLPQEKTGGKENTTLFTALGSLERICALLSSSDLGSLEETSDDDESRSRASYDSGGSLDVDLTDVFEVTSGDDDMAGSKSADRKVGNEALGTHIPSDAEAAAEKDQSPTTCLIPDCPELSPSMSPSPPSTPPGLVWSFFSERGQVADSSPTSTEFSDITPILKQDPAIYEDCASIRSSLNLSRVSGFAKRLSRVFPKDNNAVQSVPAPRPSNGSISSSLLANIRLRSGSPTSTITTLKNSSPKTSKSKPSTTVSPAHQKLSPKPTKPSKTTVQGPSKAPASLPSAKRAKGVADRKPKAEGTPTSNTPQGSKFSVGRNFLRRLSNIPGTVSRTRFGPTTSESPQSRPNLLASSPSKPAPTKPRTQTAGDTSPKPPKLTAANGTAVSSPANINAVTPNRTKPRSNTVNGYSPAKPSPLSQNVVTAPSGRPDSSSSWKRRSVQVVISTDTKVAPTTRGPRTSDPDKTVPSVTTPPRPAQRRPSAKRPGVQNGECVPTSTAPTAAFMKPVNKSATKVAKRMTNSIKPLIPTWTAGSPSSPQCGDMFRNSLSMIVR